MFPTRSADVMLHLWWLSTLQTTTAAIFIFGEPRWFHPPPPDRLAALFFCSDKFAIGFGWNITCKIIPLSKRFSQMRCCQCRASWQRMEIIRVENGNTPFWKITKAIFLLNHVHTVQCYAKKKKHHLNDVITTETNCRFFFSFS